MSGTFYGCYLLRPVILRRLIWATTASKMQLDEFSIVPQNTHQPAHPFRYLVLVFKIFLAPTRGPTPRHLASRLQPDKPRGGTLPHGYSKIYHMATRPSLPTSGLLRQKIGTSRLLEH